MEEHAEEINWKTLGLNEEDMEILNQTKNSKNANYSKTT